jgi:hypothetical protein
MGTLSVRILRWTLWLSESFVLMVDSAYSLPLLGYHFSYSSCLMIHQPQRSRQPIKLPGFSLPIPFTHPSCMVHHYSCALIPFSLCCPHPEKHQLGLSQFLYLLYTCTEEVNLTKTPWLSGLTPGVLHHFPAYPIYQVGMTPSCASFLLDCSHQHTLFLIFKKENLKGSGSCL